MKKLALFGFFLTAWALLSSSAVEGQVRIVSAPGDEYLLHITREWGRRSALGDLQEKPMRPDDIEVRLWDGYGISGTRGLILRREGGRWSAQRTIVHSCWVVIPFDAELTPELKEHYQEEAKQRWCEEMPNQRRVMAADTLEIRSIQARANLETVWKEAVTAGILELPPEVPRDWVMTDGCTYVLEVRRGDEYRASRIEETEPETDADYQIQAIAEQLLRPFAQASCGVIEQGLVD